MTFSRMRVQSLLVSMERWRCNLMKSGCLIRAYHDLETQRKRKSDFTGNRDSISVIISTGRCDIMR